MKLGPDEQYKAPHIEYLKLEAHNIITPHLAGQCIAWVLNTRHYLFETLCPPTKDSSIIPFSSMEIHVVGFWKILRGS